MSCAVAGTRERPERRQLHRDVGIELRRLGGDLSNGDEIVVADSANIARSEGDERLSSAGRCHKLHDEGIRTVNFDDGAQVASPKPFSRNVMRQHDDVEEPWGQ